MTSDHTPAEIIALSLLARDGIAAIWGLHLSAALAYQDGHVGVAAGVIEIADAAGGAARRVALRIAGLRHSSRLIMPLPS
jgi:hypothetical protein